MLVALMKAPSGERCFVEEAGGHFVEEMDEVQGEGASTVELPAAASAGDGEVLICIRNNI